jgi:hypothetical protein
LRQSSTKNSRTGKGWGIVAIPHPFFNTFLEAIDSHVRRLRPPGTLLALWDFSLPFRKHSRAASVRQARLAALLVFVTRLQKGRTASFLPRSPTPCAAAKRLRRE